MIEAQSVHTKAFVHSVRAAHSDNHVLPATILRKLVEGGNLLNINRWLGEAGLRTELSCHTNTGVDRYERGINILPRLETATVCSKAECRMLKRWRLSNKPS